VVYALGFMLGVLVNLPGYIAAQLRLALTAFQTWAVDTLAVAMVWVQALPQMIQVGLIAMGQAIRSWAIGAANAVWAWVTSALAAAQAWVVGLPQRVADGISAAVESAKQWMLALYNTVTGWFDGIVNWLKDLPARFWQAGSDAIGALVEGIKSKLHLVGGALDQGFRDAGKRLPHSDAEMGPFSRLTEAGRSIPQTIARGMAQGVGSVGRGLDALPGGRLQVSGTAGMAGAGGHPLVLELALPEGFYARQTHAAMQTPAGQQVIVRTVRKTASKGLG